MVKNSKVLSAILALCMIISLMPVTSFAADPVKGLAMTISSGDQQVGTSSGARMYSFPISFKSDLEGYYPYAAGLFVDLSDFGDMLIQASVDNAVLTSYGTITTNEPAELFMISNRQKLDPVTGTLNLLLNIPTDLSTLEDNYTIRITPNTSGANFMLAKSDAPDEAWDQMIEARDLKTEIVSPKLVIRAGSNDVNYDKGEGTGTAPSKDTKNAGATVTVKALNGAGMTPPSEKIFAGWKSSMPLDDGHGGTISLFHSGFGTGVNAIPATQTYFKMPSSDVTMTAQWDKDDNNNKIPDSMEHFVVSLDSNGGTAANPSMFVKKADGTFYNVGDVISLKSGDITLPTLPPNGTLEYVLEGWSTSKVSAPLKNSTTQAEFDALNVKTDSYTINASEASGDNNEIILYAVWSEDANGNGEGDWKEKLKYSVSYDINGGTPQITDNTVYVLNQSATVSSTVVTRTDLIFMGWQKDGTRPSTLTKEDNRPAGLLKAGDKFNVTANHTLYAVWAEDSNGDGIADPDQDWYTLSFNANNGVVTMPQPTKYVAGSSVTTPATGSKMVGGKPGILVGWVSATATTAPVDIMPDGSEPDNMISAGSQYVTTAADVTLYAVWASDLDEDGKPDYQNGKYVVVFNAANGTPNVMNVSGKPIGANVKEPQIPIRDGYVLVGWEKTSAAATDIPADAPANKVDMVTIKIGSYVVDAADDPDKDNMIYLYGVWAVDANGNGIPDCKEDKVRVTYDVMGGSPQVTDTKQYVEGQDVTVQTTQPSKTGSIFMGWQLNGNRPAADLTADDTAPVGLLSGGNIFKAGKAGDTLYAIFGVDENKNGIPDVLEDKITLSFDANGGVGTAPADIKKVAGVNASLPKTSLTMNGYVFAGWCLDKVNPVGYSGTLPTDNFYAYNEAAGTFDPSSIVMPNTDTTLYAVWSRPMSALKDLTLKIDTSESSTMGTDNLGRFILLSVKNGDSYDIPFDLFNDDGSRYQGSANIKWSIEMAGGFEPLASKLTNEMNTTLGQKDGVYNGSSTANVHKVLAAKSGVYKVTATIVEEELSYDSDSCYVIVVGDVNKSGEINALDISAINNIRSQGLSLGGNDFLVELGDVNQSGEVNALDVSLLNEMRKTNPSN